MLEKEKYIAKQDEINFPKNLKDYTKEECAIILRKALSASKKLNYQSEVAKATGINEKSIGDYFTARYKAPQKKWDLLRKVLFEEDEKVIPEHKLKAKQLIEAKDAAERFKAIAFLLKNELEYFKNSSNEVREVLKEYFPGPEAGYLASLLTALYDEDQLEIWKTFSKL